MSKAKDVYEYMKSKAERERQGQLELPVHKVEGNPNIKRISHQQVNGGTFNGEVPPARLTGTGVVTDAHNANMGIIGLNGEARGIWRKVSVNATEDEMALGIGRMRQATHTEQRALTRVNLVDEVIIITLQNAPCKNCQGAMRRATMNNSATIRYQWREDGKRIKRR